MRPLIRAYDTVLYSMAWFAGLLLVAMMVVITIDVIFRGWPFNLQTPAMFFTFTEYALLFVPCLGAPWLVREKGHIFVEIALMYLSPARRRRATMAIGIFCVIICFIIAWYGGEVTVRDYVEGRFDTRSFDVPRWYLVIWIPIGFLMMGLEFLRFLVRGENFLGLADSERAE